MASKNRVADSMRKTVIKSNFDDAKKTRKRMRDAGYDVADDIEVQHVHPLQEKYAWMSNGFRQCYTTVDGKKCRIIDFAAGQGLQPHTHDAHELFIIKSGAVKCFKWESEDAMLDGSKPVCASWLEAGDNLEIPAGIPHALYAAPKGHPSSCEGGFQFHEIIGDFSMRQTQFIVARETFGEDASKGCFTLGGDGKLVFTQSTSDSDSVANVY